MATTILIDNGHGKETLGKKSPDQKLQEWGYARRVAREVARKLRAMDYKVILITPEDEDISLNERVRRVNEYARKTRCILISIHLNAAGDGSKWLKASGWECYTSVGKTNSDNLAEYLCKAAIEALPKEFTIRTDKSDGDSDKEANFYILNKTICPAVLTENLFMDSEKDYKYLMSPEGFAAIVNLHVNGITYYVK